MIYLAERAHLFVQCIAFAAIFLVFRNRRDYLHPFNLIAYLFVLQFFIPAILLLVDSESVFGSRWSITAEIMQFSGWALLLVNIFLLLLGIGFRKRLQVPGFQMGWEWKWPEVRRLSLVLLLLFMGIMLYFATFAGGARQLVTSFHLARGTGWVNLFVILASHLVPMVLWSVGRRASAILAVVLIFLFLMFSGGRIASVVSVFWFLLFIYYLDGKDWIRWLAVGVPVLLPLSVYVVLRPHVEHLPLESVFAYNWRYLFLTELGRLQQLSVYLWFSLEHGDFAFGKVWGLSVLGPFLSGTLEYVDYRNAISARVFGLDPRTFRAGMGGTGVADLWMNGGPAALLIGPLLFGILWRTAYDYMQRHRTAFACLLYVSVSAFFYQGIQEMLTFGMLYFTVIPLVLFSMVCGLRAQEATSEVPLLAGTRP